MRVPIWVQFLIGAYNEKRALNFYICNLYHFLSLRTNRNLIASYYFTTILYLCGMCVFFSDENNEPFTTFPPAKKSMKYIPFIQKNYDLKM